VQLALQLGEPASSTTSTSATLTTIRAARPPSGQIQHRAGSRAGGLRAAAHGCCAGWESRWQCSVRSPAGRVDGLGKVRSVFAPAETRRAGTRRRARSRRKWPWGVARPERVRQTLGRQQRSMRPRRDRYPRGHQMHIRTRPRSGHSRNGAVTPHLQRQGRRFAVPTRRHGRAVVDAVQ
jgi:hypothetical protein